MNVDDPTAWINLAEEDWQLAKSLLRRKRPSPTHICFHAQQSAEKYLKALLQLMSVFLKLMIWAP